jgi:ribosomal protein L1
MSKKKKKPQRPSKELPPVSLTVQEATLVYELMHDVKVTYLNMTDEEKSKTQVKNMINLCNKIMKKVEILVINNNQKESEPKK